MLQIKLKLRIARFLLYLAMILVGGGIIGTGNSQAQSVNAIDKTPANSPGFKNLDQQNQNKNQEPNTKAEQLFLEAANNERQGNTIEAMKLYVKSLEIVRGAKLRFTVLHRMAVLNAKTKNYTASEHYFRLALADKNVNSSFLCDFAKLYADRNRLNDAETILKNAVLVAPNDRRTLFNLGQVIAQQVDRQAEGLRYLKLALGDKLAYTELAKIYRKLGSENQAQFAEQQAMLAKDDTQKNIANDNNTKEIPQSVIEKIKHELMQLEAKEIAVVQDKILTDDERKLLTDPLAANKNQTTIPPPSAPPIPLQLQPNTTSTPVSEIPLSSTINFFPAESEQKNNSVELKIVPETSVKFEPTDKINANATQQLRPINFNETDNDVKNLSSISSSQIRLIPYRNFLVDGVSDLNIVSLAKPTEEFANDVSLSFAPNNLFLQGHSNRTTVTVTQPIEHESRVKIREFRNFDPRLENITGNEYIRQNEFGTAPRTRRQNTWNQNDFTQENQTTYQANPAQPYNRSNNVTNNINNTNNTLQYPISDRREFESAAANRNMNLPKLELTEAPKNNKPKSETESFLAFRLVSDSQPQPQQRTRLRDKPQIDTLQDESPFQQEPQNTAPLPAATQPTLVKLPIETETKYNNNLDLAQNETIKKSTSDAKIIDAEGGNLRFVLLPNELRDESTDKNISQLVPKNDDLMIPNWVDVKIETPRSQQKTTTQITQNTKTQESEKSEDENKNNDKEIVGQLLAEVNPNVLIGEVVDVGETGDKADLELQAVDSDFVPNANKHELSDITVETKNIEPQELTSEKQTTSEIADTTEIHKFDDNSKKTTAVLEPREAHHLPEVKSYILWGDPTIVTQNTNENPNKENKNLPEQILTNNDQNNNINGENEKIEIQPEITTIDKPKIETESKTEIELRNDEVTRLEKGLQNVPESADELRRELEAIVPRRLPKKTLPAQNISRSDIDTIHKPAELPHSSKPNQPHSFNNEAAQTNKPNNEQNSKNYWESYSDISIESILRDKFPSETDSIDKGFSFDDDDAGVSNTRKFQQNRNRNQNQYHNYSPRPYRLRYIVNGNATITAGDFRLPLRGFRLPLRGFRLPLRDPRLPLQGFRLPLQGFRLPLRGFRLPLRDLRLPLQGFILKLF
ncbi:MAG: tetratricopeptide repeat protein [Planctomycetaceae bacterium]|jgi:tetratricopeptide (TPR) repeat protein|nr:tetratricopeptide repeat protein [Planctomycetaceae bacterium]